MSALDTPIVENPVKSTDLIDLKSLIQQSKNFQRLKKDLLISTRLSLTGITNLVVNYEDPTVVDTFLKECFKNQDLYNNTIEIDAVELQKGSPGSGMSSHWIDETIYGTYEMETNPDNADIPVPKIDPQTGKRKRQPNGFVSRKVVQSPNDFKDKVLIIKNVDYCMDFCETPGTVDARALWIFDNFRNVNVRKTCRLLLVTNKPLVFPFKVITLTLPPVDKDEANHVINSFFSTYKNKNYVFSMTQSQRDQMIRKLSGLTYTQAGDTLGATIRWSEDPPGSKNISGSLLLKKLRAKINQNFMEDGFGLTHLTPRPWEDYICPESSNFTYDVKKIMRDFKEIERLKVVMEKAAKIGKDDDLSNNITEAIQIRMPHIFVLYGKGGVGKCLGRETPVIMFSGDIKKVEKIVKGDLLMGPDSKPRKVLSTTYGVGPLYRVDQKNGDSYVCNDAHILSLQNAQKSSNREPVFISAEEFCKKDRNWKKYHNGWKSGVEFQEQYIAIDPYWFGLWLGDGTSMKPAITVANKDVEIRDWLENWAIENNLFIRKEKGNGAEAWNFSPRKGSGYCINDIKARLNRYYVLGNKHIPRPYLINSSENRLSLLAGLLDSDGYMTKTGSLQFTNVNKRLAKEVLYLVRSLGFKGFWSEGIKGIKSINYKVLAYTVTIGGDLSRIPTKLTRKQGHDNPQKKSLKCGISVNPIGIGEYFGFTLNGDHQFLLGDFTVTHNSAFPIHLAGLLEFDVWDFNINAVHSKWIGEGSKHMRETLKKITSSSHLIVRVDEYDRAMGASGESGQGMHEAHKQVESEFMNWLQNCQEENIFVKNNIIVVLTTNHKENITGPLLRSGRADLVIDIDNFDAKSMKETFMTASRRMAHRGIKVLGYYSQEELQKGIETLNLDKISELCTVKGFTVRDVETLIMEMAAHDYYHKQTGKGLPWNTETFLEVLEYSQGSVRDSSTGELVLGDRQLIMKQESEEKNKVDGVNQSDFDFNKVRDTEKGKVLEGMVEV